MKKLLPFTFALLLPGVCRAVEQVQVIGPVRISTQTALTVKGTIAHGSTWLASTDNPQLMGGFAASTPWPTAVSTGAVTYLIADPFGRLVVLNGSPYPNTPLWVNATAAGETVFISSPGANSSLYVNKVTLVNANTSAVTVSLKEGSSGTVKWQGYLASSGGSVGLSWGPRGWKLAANTQLIIYLSATGNVDCSVLEYTVGPSTP